MFWGSQPSIGNNETLPLAILLVLLQYVNLQEVELPRTFCMMQVFTSKMASKRIL
jgi:hypothetical protein